MASELQTYGITKFMGLIKDYVDVEVDPGYASIAQDIDWRSSKGAIQGAKTHTQFHDRATAVLSCTVYNNYPFYTLAETAYYTDTLKQLGGTTDWGGVAVFDEIDGKMVGANGTKLVKYDGTNFEELGVSVPTVGSFAAAGTGSAAFTVGDWDYMVTFVNNDDVEGNPCAGVTATSQGASKASCALSNIPTGSVLEGIKARRIYRTTTGGSTFYLLATINDNTTTTYTDTTVDGSLGTSSPPSTHNKPTVTCTLIAKAGTRLFIAGDATYPRRLWYSLPLPYYECFPSTYYDDFSSNIVALYSMGDVLLVQTEKGPVMFGNIDDVSQMRQYELPAKIPANSSRGVTGYRNEVYWVGPQGGFKTGGVTVDEFTELVSSLFPINTSAGSIVFDTYGTLYIILNHGAFSAETGQVVALDWSGLTESFSAETGRAVRITSTDTWLFSAELGRIVALSVGGDVAATVVLRTKRGEDELWSLDSQVVKCIVHNSIDRKTYVGMADGIYYAFTGVRRAWVWKSVYSHLGDPVRRKQLHKLRLRINGTVGVSVYGDDDTLLHTETITNTQMEVQEVVMPPASWAYKFSIKLEGSATGIAEPPVVFFFTPEAM